MKRYRQHLLSIYICLSILSFAPTLLTAQQFGFYSMYPKNWQIINPAAPSLSLFQGESENVVNVAYRQQWLGLKGSPANYNVNFETMLLDNRDKLNAKFGGGLYGETAGALTNNTLYFNYAFPLSLDIGRRYVRTHKLYIGFNAGYLHQRVNFNSIRFENNVDETISNIIKEQKIAGGQSFFELTPGVFYTNGESWYAGLSSPLLLTTGKINGSTSVINSKPQIHFIGGFYNDEMTVQPSIWLRWQSTLGYSSLISQSPLSATFNFKSRITDPITIGLGVSTGRWIHFEGGWLINGDRRSMNLGSKPVEINFAYDLPFYKSGLNLGQTAEINLVFSL